MPNYCSAGENARITFPNGSVQDFSDVPITVDVVQNPVGTQGTRGSMYYKRSTGGNYIFFNGTLYAFVFDVYVVTDGTFYTAQSLSNTTSGDQFTTTPTVNNHGSPTFAYEIEDWYWVADGSTEQLRPTYTITVTGDSGTQLFQNTFDNPNYSVECVEGCPPGTIDCGDCCLPCDETFNEVSSIRKMVKELR